MIIGLGHRKRVGKNLFATLLKEELEAKGTRVRIAAFADALYEVAHILYGWAGFASKEYYEKYGETKEVILPVLAMTPRQVLLKLGTEAIRKNVYDRTWVDLVLHKVEKDEFVIITDLRFPNELEYVRKFGGIVIRIDRSSIPDTQDVADDALANTPDEAWHCIIHNDGSIDDLRKEAKKVAEFWPSYQVNT